MAGEKRVRNAFEVLNNASRSKKRSVAKAPEHDGTAPLIVFAHGAGAPSSHPWMKGWKARLESIGPVYTFDYDYMKNGRKAPDRHDKLIAAHLRAIEEAKKAFPENKNILLVGKSMGSRMGCHVSADCSNDVPNICGVVCLGYPLRGINGKVRDEVLLSMRTPLLLVTGTKDRMGPLDLMRSTIKKMKCAVELYPVEDGSHDLTVTKTYLKKTGKTQDDIDADIYEHIRAWVAELDSGKDS